MPFGPFLQRAGLGTNPKGLIGRPLLFINDEDGGYCLGGRVEAFEVHGELSIRLFINRPHLHLVYAASIPPRGDGIFRWRLIDTTPGSTQSVLGRVELL